MIPGLYHEALRRAIELSKSCPLSQSAFSVGAIIFAADGREVGDGYSRETDAYAHAEEVALEKAIMAGEDTYGGTIVSSLEPCGKRKSKPKSCAELIIKAGIVRVVYALAEPPTFVQRTGESRLKEAGIEVIVLPEFAQLVRQINSHLA